MPRYELSEGTSNKFWEIKLSGASFTTTYGKIGTAGQTTLKEFKSEAEAKKECDKLIAEKTKKGYSLAASATKSTVEAKAPVAATKSAAPAAQPAAAAKSAAPAAKVSAAPAAQPAAAAKSAAPAAQPAAAAKSAAPAASAKSAAAQPPAAAAAATAGAGPSEPGARYFELIEGASRKFWEIKLDEESFTTRYGKIGTPGQQTEKDFDSARDARREHDKLIEEKTKKGYVEHGGPDVPVAQRNPELEQAIMADPYDGSAYMVYADWLQGQGDPRGELISLQLAAEAKPDGKLAKAAAALIERHAAYFLGPLEEHVKLHDDSDADAFTWRFGFIHKAKLSHNDTMDSEFAGSLDDALKTLLKHPSGQFVTELAFGFNGDPNDGSLDDLASVLASHAPATLRKLHFGEFEYPDETEMSWYHVGKLGAVWKAVPRLESLIVQGGDFELGTIQLPALRHAELRTGGLSAASAKAIAKASWPQIESLEVWYGDSNYGGTAKLADVRALLDRTDLPRLTSLGIRNTAFTDELPGVLAASPLVKQLKKLDLSMGILTDDGARALAAHKAAFQHLDVLDVSESYLTKAGIAALKGVAKSVESGRQRDDRDPQYRHPSVGE
ncbi:MAG TPA: WGR domain-containing protein [Kofleriaceae bacterium]|nr:WGR domain-containing protein [Kofleriaceae bacterium]